MENSTLSVFTDPLFKYNLSNEWVRKAAEEMNENPENILQILTEFREKVKNVPRLRSRLDDCFLLSFLRVCVFNQDTALTRLQKYYELREEYPEYFDPLLVSENKEFFEREIYKIIPQKDSLGRTVIILRIGNYDFSVLTIDQMFRVIFTSVDCLLLDQTFQVGGIVLVIDCTKLGLSHLRQATFKVIKVLTYVILETYPLNFKAFHILNPPMYFYALFKLIKPFLSKDTLDKMIFHGAQMKDFDNGIQPITLPVMYGGCEPGFNNEWFLYWMMEMEIVIVENHTRYGFQRTSDAT